MADLNTIIVNTDLDFLVERGSLLPVTLTQKIRGIRYKTILLIEKSILLFC